MMRPDSAALPLPWLRRVVATGCATLVLALAVFAVSPAAHAALHGDRPDAAQGDDDGCAVVLFAGGVPLPAFAVEFAAPELQLDATLRVAASEVLLVSPRGLRQPERGPPLGLNA